MHILFSDSTIATTVMGNGEKEETQKVMQPFNGVNDGVNLFHEGKRIVIAD